MSHPRRAPKRPSSIEISAENQEVLDELTSWANQTKKGSLNAILSWFGTLDRDTQGAIVGALPASRRADFARLLLEDLAVGKANVAGSIEPERQPDQSPGKKRQPRYAAKHRGQDESRGGKGG